MTAGCGLECNGLCLLALGHDQAGEAALQVPSEESAGRDD